MNLNEAQTLARTAMNAHGLTDWTFAFSRAKNTFGLTDHKKRTIYLSKVLTPHADRSQTIQVIGHEIAHALVGPGHGHGSVWKNKMVSMGLRPDRCETKNEQQKIITKKTTPPKYIVTCSKTGDKIATMERLVKQRKVRGGGVRKYKGHVCLCHRSPALYNGKSWDDVL